MLNAVTPMNQQQDSEEIEQIRKLLFGEIQQKNQSQLADVEKQIQDLRRIVDEKFSAMAEHHASSQADLLRTIGNEISRLGQQIAQLAGNPSADESGHE